MTLAEQLSNGVGTCDAQAKRLLRASTIHGLAGMAAIMASTYKAHLGEGLGPLSWITKFRVPHPGRVRGPPCCRAQEIAPGGLSAYL